MVEVKLISETVVRDPYGQEHTERSERNVLALIRSVSRSEYYAAATADMQPDLQLDLHYHEYEHEQLVEFESVVFRVFRSYRHIVDGMEMIELTCTKRRGD